MGREPSPQTQEKDKDMTRIKLQPSQLVIKDHDYSRVGTVTETLGEEVRVRWGDGSETIEHHEDMTYPAIEWDTHHAR